MPVHKVGKKWYWGSKGPFKTRAKAAEVGRAAYANGYRPRKTSGSTRRKGRK